MGEIVALRGYTEKRVQKTSEATVGYSCEIIIFSGIRYERMCNEAEQVRETAIAHQRPEKFA